VCSCNHSLARWKANTLIQREQILAENEEIWFCAFLVPREIR